MLMENDFISMLTYVISMLGALCHAFLCLLVIQITIYNETCESLGGAIGHFP